MKTCLRILFTLSILLCALSAQTPPMRPIPEVQRVVMISVDGLRPDLALRAEMPTLRRILSEGSYTFWAQTTPNSITLPSHTSMLTGVDPRKHGVEWNRDLPLQEPVYPFVPTIFELAGKAGYKTALVSGKSKFNTLNKPGTITEVAIADKAYGTDAWVMEKSLDILRNRTPDLMLIHLPDVDAVGHKKGWATNEQIATIERVDAHLKAMLAVLAEKGLDSSTLIILTADHGGAGKSHGPDDPRSRHIPWIVWGPKVPHGLDLTQFDSLRVRVEDTAATALFVLGIEVPPYFDGQPVRQALGLR